MEAIQTPTHTIKPIFIARKANYLALWARYLNWADSKKEERIFWFLKTIIIMPCIYMVISSFVVASITPHFEWFMAATVLLFFSNVVLYGSEARGSVFVTWYYFSIAMFYIVPTIIYLINL